MSFDLKNYLANNPLLNEGLSNKEQMVVDDILSVTEGPKDVYNKLVSYGKKGMMSLAIIASVLTGCAEQGDMGSAKATIEYAIENEWAGSEEDKLYLAAWYETEPTDYSDSQALSAAVFFDEVLEYSLEYAETKEEMRHQKLIQRYKEEGLSEESALESIQKDKEYREFIIQSLKDNPSTLDQKFSKALTDLVKKVKEGKDVRFFSKFLK